MRKTIRTAAIALAGALTFGGAMACNTPTTYDPTTYTVQHHGYIPPQAELVEQGVGVLSFTAETDGQVFLKDPALLPRVSNRDIPVHVFNVVRGQQFMIDPSRNVVAIDDDEMSIQLDPTHEYEIHFLTVLVR